jgi:hypothetical protein
LLEWLFKPTPRGGLNMSINTIVFVILIVLSLAFAYALSTLDEATSDVEQQVREIDSTDTL